MVVYWVEVPFAATCSSPDISKKITHENVLIVIATHVFTKTVYCILERVWLVAIFSRSTLTTQKC